MKSSRWPLKYVCYHDAIEGLHVSYHNAVESMHMRYHDVVKKASGICELSGYRRE